MAYVNHYEWLEQHFESFCDGLQIKPVFYKGCVQGILACDGDKCEQYKNRWENAGVPYVHGAAIYLITKMAPFSSEVRNTANGFVEPGQWVIINYERFKPFLADA